MTKQEEQKEKKSNKIVWFIFVFLIPLTFAFFITGVVLQVAGIDVTSKMKGVVSNIPYVSSFVKEDAKESTRDTIVRLTEQLTKTREKLEKSEKTIQTIQAQIDKKDQEIEQLIIEKNKVNSQQGTMKDVQAEQEKKRKLVLDTYTNMEPKKAALILKEMKEKEASDIMEKIPSEVLSEILANMDPKDAAKYTSLLTN